MLIGISRTSKTPLSQYLAHRSYKVMNVPIVPEVTPPDALFEIDPAKCIALKISEDKLNRIRKQRLKQLGLEILHVMQPTLELKKKLNTSKTLLHG